MNISIYSRMYDPVLYIYKDIYIYIYIHVCVEVIRMGQEHTCVQKLFICNIESVFLKTSVFAVNK